jgi:ComF family protein
MKKFLSALQNWLAPELCYGCNGQSDAPVCAKCLKSLDKPNSEALPTVFQNYPLPMAPKVYALWNFDKGAIIQKLQHALKYKNLPALGVKLGKWLGIGCLSQYRQNLPDFILPIPLSPLRFVERGYNQAEALVTGMLEGTEITQQAELLVRKTHTATQIKLKQNARWENMKSVFHVTNPEQVSGKHILLVDDVLTTGATLAAAALALYEAGAKQVDFAVLAYTR